MIHLLSERMIATAAMWLPLIRILEWKDGCQSRLNRGHGQAVSLWHWHLCWTPRRQSSFAWSLRYQEDWRAHAPLVCIQGDSADAANPSSRAGNVWVWTRRDF